MMPTIAAVYSIHRVSEAATRSLQNARVSTRTRAAFGADRLIARTRIPRPATGRV
jgi:hypothetical protein